MAQNFGGGFITHADRELFTIQGYFGSIWVMENNEYAVEWIHRIHGTEISKERAQEIINVLANGIVDPMSNVPIVTPTLP